MGFLSRVVICSERLYANMTVLYCNILINFTGEHWVKVDFVRMYNMTVIVIYIYW